MAMGQLSGRDFIDNMSTQDHSLYHLECAKIPRSNRSRINEDKSLSLYEALFVELLSRCQRLIPRHQFRFNKPLYSLDSSTIDLYLSVLPLADFRNSHGMVKLHISLNLEDYLPDFVVITEDKNHDVTERSVFRASLKQHCHDG
jgi:hypothetical protein